MDRSLRLPVAEYAPDPHSFPEYVKTTAPVDRPSIDYVVHNGFRTLHGVIAGPDDRGARALVDRIVTAAASADVLVHYVSTTTPHSARIGGLLSRSDHGLAALNRVTDMWRTLVSHSPGDRRRLLVLDGFDAIVADDRTAAWMQIIALASAADVSLLAVTPNPSGAFAKDLATDNFFHTRTIAPIQANRARHILREAPLEDLPVHHGFAYGYNSTCCDHVRAWAVAYPEAS